MIFYYYFFFLPITQEYIPLSTQQISLFQDLNDLHLHTTLKLSQAINSKEAL